MKKHDLHPLLFGLSIALSIFLSACSDDDMNPEVPVAAQDGYFIVNEGLYGGANTSLSYYDRAKDSVINNVFYAANRLPLGDQTQSMSVFDSLGFILVQNSAKIEVIRRKDFTSVATITAAEGIVSPRYFLGINKDKAYVSDWGADGKTGTVKVLDLNTYKITKDIPVGEGANKLMMVDDQVYVANQGGYGHDSTVMVINPQTDAVVDTIVVGDNPASLIIDANGNVWVAGDGKTTYNSDYSVDESASTPGFIAKVIDRKVEIKLNMQKISSGPGNIAISNDGSTLYFTYADELYKMNVSDQTMPAMPFINKSFYGLGIDPATGDILAGEAPNYSDNGTFYRYDATGNLIKSYPVGIAPNGFAF